MPDVDVQFNLREIQCELNVLSRPDGSAIFSQGNTVVVAAVYGPVECKILNSDIYKATVEVYFGTKSGQTSVRERLRESMVRQTCESALLVSLHPRDAVSINIQEMQDSGGLIATSLNACCLALINSGLAMKHLFAAVHCVIKTSGEVVLDPSEKELMDIAAQFTFAFDSIDKNIIMSSTEGVFSPEQYHECVSKCRKASDNIFSYYRDIVKKYSKAL
ncbi:exosome complex component Rrp46 [Arctopsyche grandis]|uniref:exosome complex component Rrp46 n=1 Tax=Arctopsyche grandis TaxID=121162 RepID=UPI00406D90DA